MLITRELDIFLVDNYIDFLRTCINSGITAIQLRTKNTSHEKMIQLGKLIKNTIISSCKNVHFIINDNVHVANILDADGVHLGQNDMPPQEARKILGPYKIIGLSVNSIEELVYANTLPINYIGIGAIFPTKSKKDVTTIWGLDGLKEATKQSKNPTIAIGGINEVNVTKVMHAGANGVAIIQAIHEAKCPTCTIQKILHAIHAI